MAPLLLTTTTTTLEGTNGPRRSVPRSPQGQHSLIHHRQHHHHRSLSESEIFPSNSTRMASRLSEANLCSITMEEDDDSRCEPDEHEEEDPSTEAAGPTLECCSSKLSRMSISPEETSEQLVKERLERNERLQALLDTSQWDAVVDLVENHPELAKESSCFRMVCQGENCRVTALHLASTRPNCPVAVLEAIVTACPSSITTPESRGGRWPLHLALLKGASLVIVTYLLAAYPDACLQVDDLGELPLHYAVQYADEPTIQAVLNACPQAAAYKTSRSRYPLHLLTANRCSWDQDLQLQTVTSLIQAYPAALSEPDLQERLPLHSACAVAFPRWDVLKVLIQEYPAALLKQEESHKIPLDILKRFSSHYSADSNTNTSSAYSGLDKSVSDHYDNDIVTAFLHDRTMAEKRKHSTLHKLLSKVTRPKKKTTNTETATTEIDLMNCYG